VFTVTNRSPVGTHACFPRRYQEPPIPQRITSDAYIHRLLGPTHNVKQEIDTISHYDEPAKRFMGKFWCVLSPDMNTIRKNNGLLLGTSMKVDVSVNVYFYLFMDL
jgi:hypothetical protein